MATVTVTTRGGQTASAGDWWGSDPVATASQPTPPSASDSWWNADPVAQNDFTFAQMKGEDVGRGRAALEGALSGASANFRDEILGASEASGLPHFLGGIRAPVGAARLAYEAIAGRGTASEAYDRTVADARSVQANAQEQYPGTYLAGQVGGTLALPIGRAVQAPTLAGRAVQGAGVGAAYGGLAGAGDGTDLTSRVVGAGTGAAIGGVVGAAAPVAIEGVVRGGRAIGTNVANVVRGIRDPESEAARRVAVALQRDMQADPNAVSRLTAPEFAASAQSGGPATILDIGGETTRALARSAANTSPEGRAALGRTINDRFEGQATRVSDWLRQSFHYPNAAAQSEALTQAARNVNTPAYARAFSEGRAVWTPELQRLAGAPAIQEAARAAMPSLANRGISEGFRAPRSNPFVVGPNGTVSLRETPNGNQILPDLRFWDQVKRNLDGRIGTAQRAGDNTQVSELTALKNHLVENLDAAVPSYQQARAGAAHFFGAQNALEAGENYVMQKFAAAETRQAIARMSPNERQLFQDGFVSRLVETVNSTPDRRSVLNSIANSPAAREKLNIALGPQRARELEAGLRVEGIMDLARTAVQGNSTTARQLQELGLAGGAGAATWLLDPSGSGLMNAAIVYGAARGRNTINERLSQRVADLLTSNDPQRLIRGIQMVTRNQQLFNSLRRADQGLARVNASQAPVPGLQSPVAAYTEDN